MAGPSAAGGWTIRDDWEKLLAGDFLARTLKRILACILCSGLAEAYAAPFRGGGSSIEGTGSLTSSQ